MKSQTKQYILDEFYKVIGNPDETRQSLAYLIFQVIDKYVCQYQEEEILTVNILRHVVLEIVSRN